MLLCVPLAECNGMNSLLARDPRSADWFLLKDPDADGFEILPRDTFLAVGETVGSILKTLRVGGLVVVGLQPMALKVWADSGVPVYRVDQVRADAAIDRFVGGRLQTLDAWSDARTGTSLQDPACTPAGCSVCRLSVCPSQQTGRTQA